jgi:hypothetical protein
MLTCIHIYILLLHRLAAAVSGEMQAHCLATVSHAIPYTHAHAHARARARAHTHTHTRDQITRENKRMPRH